MEHTEPVFALRIVGNGIRPRTKVTPTTGTGRGRCARARCMQRPAASAPPPRRCAGVL